jgi:hypothetical protein
MKNKRSFIDISFVCYYALTGMITGLFSFFTNFVLNKVINKPKDDI